MMNKSQAVKAILHLSADLHTAGHTDAAAILDATSSLLDLGFEKPLGVHIMEFVEEILARDKAARN